MTAFYIMTPEDVSRFLRSRDTDEPIPLSDVERRVGEGNLIDLEPIEELQRQLEELRSGFPNELRQRDPAGGRFEQRACPIVHRALSGYPQEVLANADFWTWLAVAKFEELVEWRFGTPSRRANFENYGIGGRRKRVENLLYRLWIRGEIAVQPNASDPYELARSGDQDLWRSHIIRESYANARHVARALLQLQSGQLGRKPLNDGGIRELAKRLKRLHANVFFEVLPAAAANELVLDLAKDL